jgi:UDP-N-acetylmuramate dehydrogenase
MKLLDLFGNRIKRDEPLNRHTTYRLGGPADFYFEAKSPEEAVSAIKAAKEDGVPVFLLGGGSNILVADGGFRGLVLAYGSRGIEISGSRVIVDAGAILFGLVKTSIDAGLTGLEWAAGIPGTVGGAVRGNAGAYGGEIKDNLETVQAVDLANGELATFNRPSCAFGYRESVFKHASWLVVRAVFTLTPGDKESSLAKIKEIIELRRSKQPLEFGSAGSVFKSFELGSGIPESIKADLPPKFVEYGRVPAAWLIEKAGLKGKRTGGAMISQKHANYFVNADSATAAEVRALIAYAKMKVQDELGIQLQEEIGYVGFGGGELRIRN